MPLRSNQIHHLAHRLFLLSLAGMAAFLAACSSSPPPNLSSPPSAATSPNPGTQAAPPSAPIVSGPSTAGSAPATPAGGTPSIAVAPLKPAAPSSASNPRAYRLDAASHLYSRNTNRIFKGKLPPLLYAIGVLDVELDRNGRVMALNWQRAPKHAPEVIAEIERTVRQAAPYPAPTRMGRVTYTDIWLWHESGRFQLDTLTEGQI